MKLKRLLTLAALGGAFTTLPALACVELPRPVNISGPENISRVHDGATVRVALTVDTDGRARDISVLQPQDAALEKRIRAAAAGWEFTPARKAGETVPVRVVLPLRLVGRET